MFFTGSPTKQGLLYKQSYINSLRAHAQGSVPCYYYYSIFKDMIRPCPWEEKKTFVETFKAEDGPRPRHCLAAGSPPTYFTTHDGKFAWKNLLPRFLMAKQFLYHQISKRLMQVKNLHIHEYIQLNLKIKKKKKIQTNSPRTHIGSPVAIYAWITSSVNVPNDTNVSS